MLPAKGTRNIVWIASHPKSGNTWVRFILANLHQGRVESAAELNRIVPEIHDLSPLPSTPPRRAVTMMKTHFPFTGQMPLADYTLAFVYLVRNPIDVMISAFHHLLRWNAEIRRGDRAAARQKFIEDFISHGGNPWSAPTAGMWIDHVRSWMDAAKRFPNLILRYEDLLSDPESAATALNNFLQLNKSADQLQQAIANSAFERMREVEEADIRAKRPGIFYRSYEVGGIEAGMRFVRQGKSGAAAAELTEDQRRRFLQVFGPVMAELGYT